MKLLDARRLTGLNVQSTIPGPIVEIQTATPEEAKSFIDGFVSALDIVRSHLDFEISRLIFRYFEQGLAVVASAPIDALYASVTVFEWAANASIAKFYGDEQEVNLEAVLSEVRQARSEERSPLLMKLIDEAEARNVPYLWDDDEFSLGYGQFSQTWRRDNLPSVDEVSWETLKAIPTLLITGTNGKTTTARMTAAILQAAGKSIGTSSTDGISINGEVVEEGDWTGPGAARFILRHPDVQVAVLETARGGMLRRGLGISLCDAAAVTNVAADHLGEYGINDERGMAQVKTLVYNAVRSSGTCVINADDNYVMELAGQFERPHCYTALSLRPELQSHIDRGGSAVWVQDGVIHFAQDSHHCEIMKVAEMPAAHGGAAQHNLSNALIACGLAAALGISEEAMRTGLSAFGSSWRDNPGRCHVLEHNDVRIVLDFAHNPHGMRAVLKMVQSMHDSSGRMSICFAQAGDRSEADLRDLIDVLLDFAPEQLVLRGLPETYHRGRSPEDSEELFRDILRQKDFPLSKFQSLENEVEALSYALRWAQPGDTIVHLVHLEREAIHKYLTELS